MTVQVKYVPCNGPFDMAALSWMQAGRSAQFPRLNDRNSIRICHMQVSDSSIGVSENYMAQKEQVEDIYPLSSSDIQEWSEVYTEQSIP